MRPRGARGPPAVVWLGSGCHRDTLPGGPSLPPSALSLCVPELSLLVGRQREALLLPPRWQQDLGTRPACGIWGLAQDRQHGRPCGLCQAQLLKARGHWCPWGHGTEGPRLALGCRGHTSPKCWGAQQGAKRLPVGMPVLHCSGERTLSQVQVGIGGPCTSSRLAQPRWGTENPCVYVPGTRSSRGVKPKLRRKRRAMACGRDWPRPGHWRVST